MYWYWYYCRGGRQKNVDLDPALEDASRLGLVEKWVWV